MKLRPILDHEKRTCLRTIGAYSFYALVVDALLRRETLSVIRVSDGEKLALDYAEKHAPNDPLLCCSGEWRKRFGCEGIDCKQVQLNVFHACEDCTHFAPSFGIYRPEYDLSKYYFSPQEKPLVEAMFQYHWSREMKIALMEASEKILVINRDERVFWKMRNLMRPPQTFMDMAKLSNWDEADSVLQDCIKAAPRLTLMSAGLASKWIGPRLANATKSVVLDIGQAADVWLDQP